MWYGKGPGVDRCGDVFRHANLAGTAKHGGVLVLAGDDHTCKSSTTAHQTEYAFMDYGIPVLNPANIQEFLDYGLYGWAASRYSGCWIAMKVVADNCDSTASVYIDPTRVEIKIPDDFELPEGGLNIRKASTPFITTQALEQELLLHKYKLYAALAFARANKLNKVMIDGPNRRFGIVTCGKTYMDVRQALDDLGIDDDYAKRIGLSLYKVGMTWPLERDGVRHFAEGLEEILVVEEKRALMENQLKEQLYNWKESVRPKVVGKFDENRRMDPALRRRADAGAHRPRHRQAHRPLPHQPGDRRPPEVPRGQGKGADRLQARDPPHRLFLLRLPAQHLDQAARRLARARRHRLPHHGDLDGPRHRDADPDGRRRRHLGRPGAVHQDPACVPEPGRRHLLPFRPDRDPRGGRRGRQHHLQDPVQRRRRDDRRPAVRRPAHRADDRAPAGRRGPGEDHRRHRRAGEIPDRRSSPKASLVASPRRARRGPARDARDRRRAPPSSTTRPAPPRSAAGASAA